MYRDVFNEIAYLTGIYHNWRDPDGDYKDVKGFCNSASIERVRKLDYVLTPGRYVGLPDDEDDCVAMRVLVEGINKLNDENL